MPRLQHVVILCNDPVEAGRFYENLGLTKLFEAMDPILGGMAVGFSDGEVNWSLLPTREGDHEGIAHVGFVVDDAQQTALALIEAGGRVRERLHSTNPEAAEQLTGVGIPVGSAQIAIYDLAGVEVELGERTWPH